MRWVVLVVVAGCGRIAFDPIGDGGPGVGNGDGTAGNGDGANGDGTGPDGPAMMMPLPQGGEGCAQAVVIQFGTSGTASIGTTNDVGVLPGCANGPDIVFRVDSPSAQTRPMTLRPNNFGGSFHVVRGCPPPGGACMSLNANVTWSGNPGFVLGANYIIIDKSSGTGTTFDLSLQ